MAPVPQSENHRATRQEKGLVLLARMTNRARLASSFKGMRRKKDQLPGVEELAEARGRKQRVKRLFAARCCEHRHDGEYRSGR